MKFFTKNHLLTILISVLVILVSTDTMAQKKKKKDEAKDDTLKSSQVGALKFRSIGPSFTSGRIADFAVNPENHSEYYVAVASGHIWKTTNNGTTWKPIFENYGAYAIGCLAMDPTNYNVIWAGTGENNHQRALGYGNGVYKSVNGGKSWKNMGLKESRQIGKIVIDPRDSDIVFVAAEGSAWGPGGDRGLYKTIDGGKNWTKVLEISEHTGVNDIVMDPRNPDIMYASSEQRRRHVHTKIGGGPESAIYKTVDGGENWRKLKSGLPSGDVGGIGLAISPVNPDVVYAIIEATEGSGGFFRTTNRGETWQKMSSHHASGQYYNEIICDPVNVDKVYSMETVSKVTLDAGKTWKSMGNNSRHVDDHALWVDPDDTNHWMIGGDGGVYETFDNGKNYVFKSNLPVTQFYRVNVDDSEPFYWVYGGTQDNNSLGGPSANLSYAGVTSDEWIATLGGDGFWQAIEPGNPDIVYSAYQYGNIYRYDKKSGERLNIKPQPRKGEDNYKWNWNAPYILSPHSKTRLYMAANKVFRSDDRGHSWKVISDDITAQIDRNTWPVMGRYWSIDAVSKDVSTSLYGTSVSIAESSVQEGLLYVGTDDGVIAITEDGENWRKITSFPGVPENTYVSDIFPSLYDANVVFATFDNLKRDDFKPYVLKSTDKGETWTSISSNLPENGTAHSIYQDHVKEDLLFVGTEFAIYFSVDGGKIWTRLKAGIPDVAVRDIEVQKRENDLVLATFGRGFYILDDYTPLRDITAEMLDTTKAHIFPIKDALMYVRTGGRYGQGSTRYSASNPAFGATFTYYINEAPKTLKQMRKEKEKKLAKKKEPIPMPTLDELRAEENEIKPHLIFTIKDAEGNIVREIKKSYSKGLKRMTWDMRYSGSSPVRLTNDKFNPLSTGGSGFYAMPGEYTVSISSYVRGELKELTGPVSFNCKKLDNVTFPAEDRAAAIAFQHKITEMSRIIRGTEQLADELMKRTHYVKQAVNATPGAPAQMMKDAEELESRLHEIIFKFEGQRPKASREENWPAPPSINERMNAIAYTLWGSSAAPTQTMKDQYKIVIEQFEPVYDELKKILEVDIVLLEKELEKIGAPWTPGRLPEWKSK